ncbi:MAG: putative outer rane efflux protein [Gemmatimonadetes bacterium]|nr:putative outer rane efflux protein [Gemmatimonadota bacterium]
MRLTLLALLIPIVTQSQAAPKPTLTLQDAIVMAQQQGPLAQIARSTRDAAHFHDNAFNARLLPQLFIQGNAANLNHGITTITGIDGTTQFVGQAQNQSTLTMGFKQRLALTGGTLTVGSQVSRLDHFGDASTTLYQTSPIVVSLQQDLFQPNSLKWEEQTQLLTSRVAERGYLEAREDVAGNTADAFFNLFAQQMTLANASSNVSINDTLFTLNKGRYEVGKIGENELLKSELALLRARAAVDDARLARDRAEAALRRQIAYPDGQPLTIVTPDSIPVVDANPEVAVQQALRNSSSIQQNELDDTQTRRTMAYAKANNRFNASVIASAGFNQTAPTLGPAYQSPLGTQTLTVGVNFPMLQWGAGKADVEEAKALGTRVGANNKIRRDALAEDARFSALGLQQAQRNVLISAKADTVASKQFEVARNRYIIGKITNDALYLAQGEKDAAVLANVQALRNYWTAYYHLRRVTLYDFQKKQELVDQP